MRVVTSDRGSAALLLAAAALALVLAATPLGPGLLAARDLDLPVEAIGLHLTVGHLISDGLLAVFFLLVAVELRHELTHGDLADPRAAIVPAAAALGGVAAPAGVYLLIAGGTAPGGWPVPTATDIAFALGLLALLGRGLPGRVRAFLLALAVLDDLVAILLIAVVFPVRLQPLWLLPAALLLVVFLLVARSSAGGPVRVLALWAIGVAVWYLTARSGVHATLAGVALGLLLPPGPASTADRLLQPVSRGVVLPLFAFSASLLPLGAVGAGTIGPVFWGVAVALPLGKLLGIGVVTTVVTALVGRSSPSRLRPAEVLVVGVVAGVGFTVSLLMSQLAFGDGPAGDAGVLGVLSGSAIAILLSAVVVPVVAARATRDDEPVSSTWEQRVEAFWAEVDPDDADAALEGMRALVDERPDDPAARYEWASVHDLLGLEAEAVPLYRAAIDGGLAGDRLPQARLQLALSLRNIGDAEAAVALLRSVPADEVVGPAREAFLALALHDLGRHDEALRTALHALAPTLPRYGRAVAAYADGL